MDDCQALWENLHRLEDLCETQQRYIYQSRRAFNTLMKGLQDLHPDRAHMYKCLRTSDDDSEGEILPLEYPEPDIEWDEQKQWEARRDAGTLMEGDYNPKYAHMMLDTPNYFPKHFDPETCGDSCEQGCDSDAEIENAEDAWAEELFESRFR
jgi:hypothetical protein